MFNPIFGIILIYLGGFTRYIYGTLIRKMGLSQPNYYTLKEYIHGSQRPEDEHWDKGGAHEFVNRIVGTITLIFLISFLMYLETFL